MHARLGRHRTRRIASLVLFVWLFAAVASWAHACILQPESSRDHRVRGGLVAALGAGHEAAAGASESHEPDPAQQACASFCDAEQSIVTKAQTAKGDGAAEPLAVTAQVVASWPAFTRGRAAMRRRPLATPPTGPRVAIAFLRLTI